MFRFLSKFLIKYNNLKPIIINIRITKLALKPINVTFFVLVEYFYSVRHLEAIVKD